MSESLVVLAIIVFALTLVALTAIGSQTEGKNKIAIRAIEVLKTVFHQQ